MLYAGPMGARFLCGCLAMGALVWSAGCGKDPETCEDHHGSETVVCSPGHDPQELGAHNQEYASKAFSSFNLHGSHLELDATYAYWVGEPGLVLRTNRTTLETVELYKVSGCGVIALGRAADRLFIAENCSVSTDLRGTVLWIPVDGGQPTETLSQGVEIMDMAVDPSGSGVYVLQATETQRALVYVNAQTSESHISQVGTRFRGVAAAAGEGFVGQCSWQTEPSDVVGVAPDGSTRELGSVPGVVAKLTVSGDHLYVREEAHTLADNPFRLFRRPLAGGGAFELALPGAVTEHFAIADPDIYGVGPLGFNDATGKIGLVHWRLSDGAGEYLIMFKVGRWPSAIAVDASHAYWIDFEHSSTSLGGTTRLMRAPR